MNLQSWMVNPITVASVIGVNNFGEPVLGPQRTVNVRVEKKTREVVDTDGQTVLSDTTIASTEEIKIDDHIWFQGQNATIQAEARTPKNIQQASDKTGQRVTLWEVFL